MNPDERRQLVRQHIKSKWQGTGTYLRDYLNNLITNFTGHDKDAIRRNFLCGGVIPAIADDWLAVMEVTELEHNLVNPNGSGKASYFVNDNGDEFRDNKPYYSIVEEQLTRRRAQVLSIVEKVYRIFASDVTYMMDAMLLGHSEGEIRGSMSGEKGYLDLCFAVAMKYKIRRHIELEAMKRHGHYAIADSIREAGEDIREGLEAIAASIDMGAEKVSKSLLAGFQSVAQSNMHIARSLENIASSQGEMATAIQELYEPIAGAAYASRRYTDLKEQILRESQETQLRPVASGSMLFVNVFNGSSMPIQGTAYKRDGCYIVNTSEGPMFLPENAFVLFDSSSGNVAGFRERINQLNK